MTYFNCDEIRNKRNQIQDELASIARMEKQFPNGELICSQNGKRYKWFVKSEENKDFVYLPKSNYRLAEELALKKYYTLRKHELEQELSVYSTYLRKMLPVEGQADDLLCHPEYGRLLQKHFMPMQKELQEWQDAKYEKCSRHEENLIIKGTQGKLLRSKSEAIIDLILYQKRIPFRYEEKLTLGTTVVYPDFTIRHPKTGAILYWEHFGMMDNENYRDHACDKIRLYCRNGIYPAVNLIMTFETRENPLSAENVEKIVTDIL